MTELGAVVVVAAVGFVWMLGLFRIALGGPRARKRRGKRVGKVHALTTSEGAPTGLALNFEGQGETVNVSARGLVQSKKDPNTYEGPGVLEAVQGGATVVQDPQAAVAVTWGEAPARLLLALTVSGRGVDAGTHANLVATGKLDVDGSGTMLEGDFAVGHGKAGKA